MKAMILAAGYGTRLGILSKQKPKPMLPVFNFPLILYSIEMLKQAGITEIAINVHHKGNALRTFLKDGKEFGVNIFWSVENNEILGTGGGVKKIADFFGNEPCVVLNGKIVTNTELKTVLNFHKKTSALGTMVLRKDENASKWGSIGVDDNYCITEMLGKDLHDNSIDHSENMFTGIQILEPEFIKRLPEGQSCIVRQGWIPFFHQNLPLNGFVLPESVYWWEHSTPERYLKGNVNIFDFELYKKLPICFSKNIYYHKNFSTDFLISNGIHIFSDTNLLVGQNYQIKGNVIYKDNVFIGNNVKVEGNIRLQNCIIWNNTTVNTDLVSSIATPLGVLKTNPNNIGAFTGPKLKK